MTTIRTRFAPSPTGYLHVGGARTALYAYLFAKANKGKFILRIEDTDEERSKREFEGLQREDLRWLGIDHDEGPDKGGDFGPYRQSERLSIYKEFADQLIKGKKAFYCFCTSEELKLKKEQASSQDQAPHYDGTCRKLSDAEIAKKLSVLGADNTPSIRFIAPHKDYTFVDQVRGQVTFPSGMVGDFVIVRSGGMPVYNYCCVIDDWQMQMTHVIRGEEHLPNTLRQLMLYEAYGAVPPIFAHLSLIIGADRQKLSKRHGAVSVGNFRDEAYLSSALANYLLLLGWSHPTEKDIFYLDEIKEIFDLTRFSKSPAIYDLVKLKWMNGQHLRLLSEGELLDQVMAFLPPESPFHIQDRDWQIQCLNLYRNKMEIATELEGLMSEIFDTHIDWTSEHDHLFALEETRKIYAYVQLKLKTETRVALDSATITQWMEELKKEHGIKGKNLFMGLRVVLTGRPHGSDLLHLIPLTPLNIIQARLLNLGGKLT
jgi:nondiscriminating glutamyl-tRNA synthetase